MRLKLLISLIVASILSFGQDSLPKDSISKSSKRDITHAKKYQKKNKNVQFKKEETTSVNNTNVNTSNSQALLFLIFIIAVIVMAFTRSDSVLNYKRNLDDSRDEDVTSDSMMRMLKSRRDYYRDIYLKSNEWKRKRYVVLKRDNWRCVYCGARATQVHHTKYAKKNIGKEPIEWLVSVCKPCHDSKHQ